MLDGTPLLAKPISSHDTLPSRILVFIALIFTLLLFSKYNPSQQAEIPEATVGQNEVIALHEDSPVGDPANNGALCSSKKADMEAKCKEKGWVFNGARKCLKDPCKVNNDYPYCCEKKANCGAMLQDTGKACTFPLDVLNIGRDCAGTTCKESDRATCCVKQGQLYRAKVPTKIYKTTVKTWTAIGADKNKVQDLKPGAIVKCHMTADGHRDFFHGPDGDGKMQSWLKVEEPEAGWVIYRDTKGVKLFRMIYPTQTLSCDQTFAEVDTALKMRAGDTIQARCPKQCLWSKYEAIEKQKAGTVDIAKGKTFETGPLFQVDHVQEGGKDTLVWKKSVMKYDNTDLAAAETAIIMNGDSIQARMRDTGVKGCGSLNSGFLATDKWFTKDSRICFGAQLMGPKEWEAFDLLKSPDKITKYEACSKGGVKTDSATLQGQGDYAWRVSPLGTDTVSQTKSGYMGKMQNIKRQYQMASASQKISIVVKIVLKTAIGLALGIATTALMGVLAGSGVGLPLAILGIVAITIGRTFVAAMAGAVVDSTVDWVAEKIKSKGEPVPLKAESKTNWETLKAHLGKNFRGALPWNDKAGWARMILWESLGHFISITGCFTGPFQFDSGGDWFQFDEGAMDIGWSPDGRSLSEDMYGMKFDYTPSVITAAMDAFIDMTNEFNKKGKDSMELFLDMAGVTPDILAKLKGGDANACKPEKECYLNLLAYDSEGRLVVTGNVAFRIFKFLKVPYKVTKTELTMNKIYSPEEIAEKNLDGNKKMQIYTYHSPGGKGAANDDKVDWGTGSIRAKDMSAHRAEESVQEIKP